MIYMNKEIIITALLALLAMTGQGQVKCHVEGKFVDNKWGDEVVIWMYNSGTVLLLYESRC